MIKPYVKVRELLASDLPLAVRPFFVNVVNNKKLRIALTIDSIVCYCGLYPRIRVKYVFDHSLSMLLLNQLVVGPSGSGKSWIRWVVNLIMQKLVVRDSIERERLREYKETNMRKGANKEKAKEPLVCIRFLQKFTLPILVKYADYARRKYGDYLSFFLFSDEMGSFVENKRSSREYQSVARTAYNLDEIYSRDTLYDGGYNANVSINWCSIICGQNMALEKYVDREAVVGGDAGRHILCCLDDSLAQDAPVVLPLDQEQLLAVEEAVERGMKETCTDDDKLMPIHLVDMAWMYQDVKDWCEYVQDQILKTASRAMNSFYVRASSSAFRIATMLYHLWGETEESRPLVSKCYFYFANFILDSAMEQWSDTYEETQPKTKQFTQDKLTLFDQMPNEFSRDQLREMVHKLQLGTETRQFIHKWLNKGWIVQKDTIYVKKKM